jgi:putative superfamily III holin-X
VAVAVESVAASPAEDEPAEQDETPSLTDLLAELARNVSVLVFCETQLVAVRNMPQVRRTARDIGAALVAATAFLTAFVFANVAGFLGLSTVMSGWGAALLLCAVWVVLGVSLVLVLMIRAGQVSGWRWWRIFGAGPEEAVHDLEQAVADAKQAVLDTLGRLAPAISIEIASASVAMAGDVAGDVVDTGQDILEASDELVESITEDLPAGGVVNQIWDVVLMPGRFGLKVATTVLKGGEPGKEQP